MPSVVKTFASAVAVLLLILPASAAQFVYPAKGQTPEQQATDEAECSNWATSQTGFDPSKPSPVVATAAPAEVVPVARQSMVGGAVKGAIVGSAIGAIGGNDAGNAAGKGAVLGAATRRAKNKGAQEQQVAQEKANQQQAAAAQNEANTQQKTQQDDHQKARSVCLEGRGYTVK